MLKEEGQDTWVKVQRTTCKQPKGQGRDWTVQEQEGETATVAESVQGGKEEYSKR